MPGHHYWPIRPDHKCPSIKFAVDWGNKHQKEVTMLVLIFHSRDIVENYDFQPTKFVRFNSSPLRDQDFLVPSETGYARLELSLKH